MMSCLGDDNPNGKQPWQQIYAIITMAKGVEINLLQFLLLINVQRVVTMLFFVFLLAFRKPEKKSYPRKKLSSKIIKTWEKMFSSCRPICCEALWWSGQPFFNSPSKMKKFWLIRAKKIHINYCLLSSSAASLLFSTELSRWHFFYRQNDVVSR